MNVAELNATEALNAGADLWIIKNDSQNKWWQELDFRSGFLLSECLYHNRRPMATKVNEILDITELPRAQFFKDSNNLLVGTSDHFANKWICCGRITRPPLKKVWIRWLLRSRLKAFGFFPTPKFY